VPVKFNALPTVTPPINSKAAPLDTAIEELPKPALWLNRSTPPLTLVLPVYTFDPLNANTPAVTFTPTPDKRPLILKVPLLSFVNEPVPKETVPSTTTEPFPPTSKLVLVPLIEVAPLKVNTPESLLIRVVAVAKVTTPAQLLFPLILRKAPKLLLPGPDKLNGKAPILIPPCNCKVALVDTVVKLDAPKPLLCRISKNPWLTDVGPVYVFDPLKVKVPVLVLVNPTLLAVPFSITPL
jgi:hypothetical protein